MNPKPIEQILNAPVDVLDAMIEWRDSFNYAVDLHDDICDKFDSPMLWLAIAEITEQIVKRERALARFTEAGFTCDDVFTYDEYNKNDEDEKERGIA